MCLFKNNNSRKYIKYIIVKNLPELRYGYSIGWLPINPSKTQSTRKNQKKTLCQSRLKKTAKFSSSPFRNRNLRLDQLK